MAKKVKPAAADQADQVANQFEYGGKKYNVLRGANVRMEAGHFELLTAADICVHEEAQKYLVENGCGNIEEVIE